VVFITCCVEYVQGMMVTVCVQLLACDENLRRHI